MLIVRKYEGIALERLSVVAWHIHATRQVGNEVVVVSSSIAEETNWLLGLAHTVSKAPKQRELDMLLATGEMISSALLSMALQNIGCPAESFFGGQAGILAYRESRKRGHISRIDPLRIQQVLKKGIVPVIAGSQGKNRDEVIVGLGHGGSDLTAIYLAATLKADVCEIYTEHARRAHYGVEALQKEVREVAEKSNVRLVVCFLSPKE